MANIWTTENVEIMSHHWLEGFLPASEIAAILGPEFTKNSVICKANRIGLAARCEKAVKVHRTRIGAIANKRVRSAPVEKPKPKPEARNVVVDINKYGRKVPLPKVAPEPDTSRRRLYLEMPERGLCKYIVEMGESISDRICCGQPQRAESAYCGHHHRLCYRPTEKLDVDRVAA